MTATGSGSGPGGGASVRRTDVPGVRTLDVLSDAELGGFDVLAAGGVVWRQASSRSGIEVLVVHRPRYDDWTLPKGKVDPGESLEECALREVSEETGLGCRLGPVLRDVTYVDHKGRTKLARYWAMTAVEGAFSPNDEVDQIRWLAPTQASRLLTYEHDRPVVDELHRRLAE